MFRRGDHLTAFTVRARGHLWGSVGLLICCECFLLIHNHTETKTQNCIILLIPFARDGYARSLTQTTYAFRMSGAACRAMRSANVILHPSCFPNVVVRDLAYFRKDARRGESMLRPLALPGTPPLRQKHCRGPGAVRPWRRPGPSAPTRPCFRRAVSRRSSTPSAQNMGFAPTAEAITITPRSRWVVFERRKSICPCLPAALLWHVLCAGVLWTFWRKSKRKKTDFAVEPASSAEHGLDNPGGEAVDDDPGGGSIISAEDDSALIVPNTSKNSSSPLLSSFATGLTSSRASSSIVAMDAVSDDSDDEDVEYKGHFCSGCSIPPPGGVCVGGFSWVSGVLGCGKRPWVCVLRRLLCVGFGFAAKTTIERSFLIMFLILILI